MLNIAFCADEANSEMNDRMLTLVLEDLVQVELDALKFGANLFTKMIKERGKQDSASKEEVLRLKKAFAQGCEREQKYLPRTLYRTINLFVGNSFKVTTPEQIRALLENANLMSTYHFLMLPLDLNRFVHCQFSLPFLVFNNIMQIRLSPDEAAYQFLFWTRCAALREKAQEVDEALRAYCKSLKFGLLCPVLEVDLSIAACQNILRIITLTGNVGRTWTVSL